MIETRRSGRALGLIVLAGLTLGGTCVVVEEGPPGAFEGPGNNEEAMQEQEREILEDENR